MVVEPRTRRPKMERDDLARRLRVLRAERSWGLIEAAKKIGISANTLADAESGKRMPNGPTLTKLASAYGVPFAKFFTDAPVRLEDQGDRVRVTVDSEEYIDIAAVVATQVWEIFAEKKLAEDKAEELQKTFAAALRRSFEGFAE
jgi:transcriptional regulator with XRE-family HTH domain